MEKAPEKPSAIGIKRCPADGKSWKNEKWAGRPDAVLESGQKGHSMEEMDAGADG